MSYTVYGSIQAKTLTPHFMANQSKNPDSERPLPLNMYYPTPQIIDESILQMLHLANPL